MQAHAAPLYFRSPWYFSLQLLVAIAGFFPSYFARLGQPGRCAISTASWRRCGCCC